MSQHERDDRDGGQPRDGTEQMAGGAGRKATPLAAACLALALAGCDFDVSNPGPVPDEFLDDADAHPGLVNGMARAFANQLTETGRVMGAVTREIFPSGNTGNYGITVNEGRGVLLPEDVNGFWSAAHNARWVAEDGIRRLEEVLDPQAFQTSTVAARSYLWAGYSNRFLGENFCEAVFDGGGVEPRERYFTRAEEQFTNALEIAMAAGASDVANAARAGRASVRASLGDWAGVRADASQVPLGFEFEVDYSAADRSQYNAIWFAVANEPYRGHSTWNTPYEAYFLETGDPRTPWGQDPDFPHGPVQRACCGLVPWYFQQKYTAPGDDVDLSDGREMQLLLAEAELVEGDWEEALTIINELRGDVGVVPWEASTLEETWTVLKRERGIELWLEGRRAGDLSRWEAAGTPGDLHPLEDPSNPDTHLVPERDLCIPISLAERETNPNIPLP